VLTLNRLRHNVGCASTAASRPAATWSSPPCWAPRNTASAPPRWSPWAASWCASAIPTPARSASAPRTRSLREKFTGTPEKVVNLFTFIAEEVRRSWPSSASLAQRDHRPRPICCAGQPRVRRISTISTSTRCWQGRHRRPCRATAREGRNEVPDTLDAQMIEGRQAPARARREDAAHLQRCATRTAPSARGCRRKSPGATA
jgi:hypothetical protein